MSLVNSTDEKFQRTHIWVFLESIISSSLDNLRDISYGMVIPEHLQKTPCEKQRTVDASSVLPYREAELQ